MNFDIAPTSPVPIYKQIVEQVRRMVASGQLAPGEDMPSVRAVAQHHAINPMTVSKAYSMLESEGLLERRRGVGMAVAGQRGKTSMQDKAAMLRPALEAAARMAHQLALSDKEALALFQTCLQEQHNKESA
ncbi:GntR family transcriptional regulator [Massilia sp. erpn]|uniref:GntR family transcriptional regulator n=1 Tax=Massilia sp. erpn TaxID=2738142 RepID=UPI0021065A39|nr:GntR family transcriptional regulator [Massilia sp. erpn]UTY58095.1 GntR family transcriptional regulator [Massilia sp. erpn]